MNNPPGDVVGLIAVEGRPVGHVGPGSKIAADVADGDLVCKAKHSEACNQA